MRARGVRRRIEDRGTAEDGAEHAVRGGAREPAASCGTGERAGQRTGGTARGGARDGYRERSGRRRTRWTRQRSGPASAAEAPVHDAETGDADRLRGHAVT